MVTVDIYHGDEHGGQFVKYIVPINSAKTTEKRVIKSRRSSEKCTLEDNLARHT